MPLPLMMMPPHCCTASASTVPVTASEKEVSVIGADGEAFLDFAIKDALAAGMDKVVLIVRSDIEDDVRRHVDAQHPGLAVEYVLQDTHGPSRAKPWGTAHAVLTAAPAVPGAGRAQTRAPRGR